MKPPYEASGHSRSPTSSSAMADAGEPGQDCPVEPSYVYIYIYTYVCVYIYIYIYILLYTSPAKRKPPEITIPPDVLHEKFARLAETRLAKIA